MRPSILRVEKADYDITSAHHQLAEHHRSDGIQRRSRASCCATLDARRLATLEAVTRLLIA